MEKSLSPLSIQGWQIQWPQLVVGGKTEQRWSLGTYRGCQGPPGQAKEKEDPGPHGDGNPVGRREIDVSVSGRLPVESSFWCWIPVIGKIILDGTY